MDKFVITVGRELGSGGKSVAEALARELGVAVYDRRLIEMAAEESGFDRSIFEQADERTSRGWMSALLSYLRSPFTGADAASQSPLSGESLFRIQSDVIRGLAERESCVFVGRCADYILRDHPRPVSLFVTADRADRVERLCASQRIAPAEAGRRIDAADSRRASYYGYFTGRTWGAASSYDLCVNTSRLGIDATVRCLLEYVDRRLGLGRFRPDENLR